MPYEIIKIIKKTTRETARSSSHPRNLGVELNDEKTYYAFTNRKVVEKN